MTNLFTFDIPFAVLALFYPVLRHRVASHAITCSLKCLPMAFLILTLYRRQQTKLANQYTKNVMLGLIFSTIGDAFLDCADLWTNALLGGIVAFGTAHIFYISAFGLKPFKLSGAAIVVAIELLAILIIRQPLIEMGTLYLSIIPFYMVLLLAMAWRATAESGAKSVHRLQKMGGFSFVVSDGILALTEITGIVSRAVVTPQMSTYLVLSTYYLAQFCFAKSALESATSAKANKKR